MSTSRQLWRLGKVLQGIGLVIVLVGLLVSVETGMRDEGLTSQRVEFYGLILGGGLFMAGWLLQRSVGGR